MNPCSKDEVERKVQEVKRAMKAKVGKLTNTPELEADGKAEKVAGRAQRKIGQVKKAVGQ